MRKEKKEFTNLNEHDIIDNKKIWQTVKPFLSEKFNSKEKITLVEKGELVQSKSDVAKCFNQYFPNIVKNLNIPKYMDGDTLHLNLNNYPTFKIILNYREHLSIGATTRFRYRTASF